MSARSPLWKRKGYPSDAEYKSACAATRMTRKAALAATSVKGLQLLLLEKMWNRAEFDRPSVTVTREQLMADTGCSLDSVKRAFRNLRAEGSIRPARNWKGGRGVPTTWLLRVAGVEQTPADVGAKAAQDARQRDAAWRFLAAKYGPLKARELMGPMPGQDDVDLADCG